MASNSEDNNREDHEVFPLESDQLALKGNPDYERLLNTIARLEAVRQKQFEDLNKIHEIKVKALEDPVRFLEQLQKNPKSIGIPVRTKIPEVPNIDWRKYSHSASGELADYGKLTRGRKVALPEALKPKIAPAASEFASASDPSAKVVRGRLKLEDKPDTFNQLWTADEQRQLEGLLHKYPPERVEARRFRKIADELKTKTHTQVCSRIQKYFIRLHQAGLPVPGRVPSLAHLRGPKRRKRHRHHLKNKLQTSTLLQAYTPPVFMNDDDDDQSQTGYSQRDESESSGSSSEESDSDEGIAEELKSTPEFLELVRLRDIKKQRIEAKLNINNQHHGYKCDGCGVEPILGMRYHCTVCPEADSVDFCYDCNSRHINVRSHSSSHAVQAISASDSSNTEPQSSSSQPLENFYDQDYLSSKFNIPGQYNYLDPNYQPDQFSNR